MGEKLSFKRVEMPLSKFNNVAIPHHLELLKKHKHNIQMYQTQHEWDRVRIEQNNATRLVKQLKQLLYEMDVLRAQVQDCDLDKFDKDTIKSKQTIMNVISEYLELVTNVSKIELTINRAHDENEDTIEPLVVGDLEYENDLIHEKEACLKSTQELQRNIEDLQVTFAQLNQLVHEQGELVDQVEENVETAVENVHAGTMELAKAVKYKKAMYPLTGAAIGTCIGGPIGFVAGLKLGGLAALGCGITGYFGGKLLTDYDKNLANESVSQQNETESTANKSKIL